MTTTKTGARRGELSGSMPLPIRLSNELREELRVEAEALGMSLNAFAVSALESVLELLKGQGDQVTLPKFIMVARYSKTIKPTILTIRPR